MAGEIRFLVSQPNPPEIAVCRFPLDGSTRFIQLWKLYENYLFYVKGEQQPFCDINRPLDTMQHIELEAREWPPGHEALRAQVEAMLANEM